MRAPHGTLLVAVALSACGSPSGPEDRDSIEAWMAYHRVPGVAVAVIENFQVAYAEYHGVMDLTTGEPVTAETLFQAASLSKGVSAAGVLTLVREGRISLDRDVRAYLTSWSLPFSGVAFGPGVTARRLLSHTAGTTVSGFRGYRTGEAVPTLLQILDGVPPANSPPVVVAQEPGARFAYSGGGYLVLQQALLDELGTPFDLLMEERVLGPVGMDSSTYRQPLPADRRGDAASGYYADGRAVPGGHHRYPETAPAALWTTPTDLARFLVMVQRALRGEPGLILDRASAEDLLTEVRRDYGLGFDLNMAWNEPYFGHQGANDGFRSGMIAHATSGDGLVMLTNSDRGSDLFPDVLELVARRHGWPGR